MFKVSSAYDACFSAMNLHVQPKIGFSRQVDLLFLASSWFLFGFLFQSLRGITPAFLLWVLLTSLLSMLSLGAIGYFDHHIPKPELSGVLTLFLALPVSAFFCKWFIALVTGVQVIRYSEALRASVWVAFES